MSGFICKNCNKETKIFKSKNGGGEKLSIDFDIPFLGKIPLDPDVMNACENGKSILKEFPDSKSSIALKSIVDKVKKMVIKE